MKVLFQKRPSKVSIEFIFFFSLLMDELTKWWKGVLVYDDPRRCVFGRWEYTGVRR